MATPGPSAVSRRQVLERHTHLRDDHLRYMQKWGLIQPSHRAHGEVFYAFGDLATIRQADAELGEGVSFRAVLRNLLASRHGQLTFDFRLDARPAKILQLKRPEAPPLADAHGRDARRRSCSPPSRSSPLASSLDDGDPAHFDDALDAYRRTLEIDPYLVPALINLANIHYARSEMAEAQALYERAIALEPDVFESHFNLGNIFHDLGRYTEAQECYREALRINPTYADAHFYLAVSLEKSGLLTGGAAALACVSGTCPERGVGAPGARVLGLTRRRAAEDARAEARALRVARLIAVLVRVPLLRCAAQLVVLAVHAPRLRIEARRARVGLDFAMRAERRVAILGGLLPPARIESHSAGGLWSDRLLRRFAAAWWILGRRVHRTVTEVGLQRLSPAREARVVLRAPPASGRSRLIRHVRFGRRDARTLPGVSGTS